MSLQNLERVEFPLRQNAAVGERRCACTKSKWGTVDKLELKPAFDEQVEFEESNYQEIPGGEAETPVGDFYYHQRCLTCGGKRILHTIEALTYD